MIVVFGVGPGFRKKNLCIKHIHEEKGGNSDKPRLIYIATYIVSYMLFCYEFHIYVYVCIYIYREREREF